MNLSKEKFLIKRHSERSHAVAKSKNLGRCVIASLVSGVAISCLLFLAACGDDPKVGGTEEDAGIIAIENKTVSGVSQKGPFVNGSSVTVYGLDGETLAQTGNIYEGKIRSDMGDFSVKVVKLASQYALLKANGFYRNEVTGEKSNSQMTLYALTDLSDRDEVNVNLLTHLAYERSLYLATNSISVANAKKQAEMEVFKSFEIEGDFASAEDLNIFGENDQSAALLAISVLMQGDLKEADFSERLDNYARDIEADGVWDDKKTATAIADWASTKSLEGGLAAIRNNIANWGLSTEVPDFEKYVNNFWWQNYGLKTCDAKREGEILQASNPLSANNGVHFICNNGGWRVATDLEKDTYKWEAGKDADNRYGDVIKTNCYVFEDKAWRSGDDMDCFLNLRGCTTLRQDTVGQGKDKEWYICDSKNWRNAEDIEKDTATWGAGKFDEEIRVGQINEDTYYIYEEEKKSWRVANAFDRDVATWGAGKFDGEIRTGQVNKTIYYIYETSKKAWREATTLEKDTYDHQNNKDWTNGADGEIRKGSVTSTFYVFDTDAWRVAEDLEQVLGGGCVTSKQGSVMEADDFDKYCCTANGWQPLKDWSWDIPKELRMVSDVSYGVLIDSRDDKTYKTVKIGELTWMAENLNYSDSTRTPSLKGKSWCYDNDVSKCNVAGRLYTWAAAIDSAYLYEEKSLDCGYGKTCTLPDTVYGICPPGWHLPNKAEWGTLYDIETKALLSSNGWGVTEDGMNTYGFSALPTGNYHDNSYDGAGCSTAFWSSSETASPLEIYFDHCEHDLGVIYKYVNDEYPKKYGNPVRCVKDKE